MSLRTRIVDTLASPRLLPAREAARTASRRVLGGVTRGRMAVTRGTVPGLLSIVVPMYNVERYIGECLESLMRQNYPRVQIIVVDDGSPDRSYEVARRYARRDPRIEIVRRENGGLSAARNTGMQHARGEFLAFLDSDDFVDRHAYSDAIEMLRRSGSDFAVMPYRRALGETRPPATPWVRAAHAVERIGTDLQQFPDIMVNAVAWSKVYRREFWDRHGFEFPVGVLYEDQAVSMAAFAAAESFDVLSRVSLNWRIREDQTSITQNNISVKNLRDHHIAVRDSLRNLEKYGALEARDRRITHFMNNNFGEFLWEIRSMSDEAWAEFSQSLHFVSDLMSPELWRQIEVRRKVMVRLCAAGRRDLAQRFLQEQGWQRDLFGGAVDGDRIIAELPMQAELESVLEPDAFVFADRETQLEAVLRSSVVRDGALEIDFFAYVNHLKSDTEPYELVVHLRDPEGRRTPVATERLRDAAIAIGHSRRYADASYGAARARVPLEALADEGEYFFDVDIVAGDFARSGVMTIDSYSRFSPAAAAGDAAGADASMIVAFEGNEYGTSAVLRVRRVAVAIRRAEALRDRVLLTLHSERRLTQGFLRRTSDRLRLRRSVVRLQETERGVWSCELQLPGGGIGEAGPFEHVLVVQDAEGNEYLPSILGAEIAMDGERGYIAQQRHRRGEESGATLVVDMVDCALVTGVASREDSLVLTVREYGRNGRLTDLAVRSELAEVPARLDRGAGGTPGELRVEVPLLRDPWGLGPTALASGTYDLQGVASSGAGIHLYLDETAVAESLVQRQPLCTLELERDETGRASLQVRAPLATEPFEKGAIWRMRDRFYGLKPSDDPQRSILFRNRWGEDANDSALAVSRELTRRGSDLRQIWAVRDHSVRVPEGAEVVLEESPEFFEALGTANYFMVNVHQPDWYRKPEGQVLIQTHHGYPFKLQGRRWWDRMGYGGERRESFVNRADDWDYLVVPAGYALDPLLEYYRESGPTSTEMLEIGYPRNDALLNGSAESVRAETRKRLGIGPDQRAVLYAPTYRDYLSSNQMSARLVEDLDTERLSRELGPDYVVLLRGHPFNSGTTHGVGHVIDVTDYPDVNDLILASDLAVLDYSSLRFDYALTGKPMLFFVPDEERYFAGRETFVPFSETSPGPHVTDQSTLTRLIRDSGRVGAGYADARARFIEAFLEHEDGHAAERLVEAVFAPRGDA